MLRDLDVSSNNLTVVCIEAVCSIISALSSLEVSSPSTNSMRLFPCASHRLLVQALDLRSNHLGASKEFVNGLVGNAPPIKALQALPTVLNNLPAAFRAGV